MIKRITLLAVMALILSTFPIMTVGATGDHPALTPADVTETVAQGGSFDVAKTVHTPEIPPKVDVCLLEDETGSFFDDIGNLQSPGVAAAIYNSVTSAAPDSQFAVAGFRDYGDAWVYRLLSGMSPLLADWQNGINALTAGGGGDFSEAQYDAISSAVSGAPYGDPCGFRADPTVARVLVVTTDATFHSSDEGAPWQRNQATTLADLAAANVTVIGLKAPGAGGELDALAAATGGSVQALSSDGANIGAAIVAGLSNLPVEVSMTSDCAAETGGAVTTGFAPAVRNVTSGDDADFTETITVAADAEPGEYSCRDWALVNGEPMKDAAGAIIYEYKTITVGAAYCLEGVNPAGKTPKAPGTGQNEDGFYLIGSTTGGDVSLIDDGSGTVFGPFPSATNIKYTENDDEISIEPGSGAVIWKIKGLGDAVVSFTDLFGNTSYATCLVPPAPK